MPFSAECPDRTAATPRAFRLQTKGITCPFFSEVLTLSFISGPTKTVTIYTRVCSSQAVISGVMGSHTIPSDQEGPTKMPPELPAGWSVLLTSVPSAKFDTHTGLHSWKENQDIITTSKWPLAIGNGRFQRNQRPPYHRHTPPHSKLLIRTPNRTAVQTYH